MTEKELLKLIGESVVEAICQNCSKVEVSAQDFGVLIQSFYPDRVVQSSTPFYQRWPSDPLFSDRTKFRINISPHYQP